VGNIHAKFQASSFTGVGGVQGEIPKPDVTPDPDTKFLNSHLHFACFVLGGLQILINL